MNYRHAFHAGNFADVHKHAILSRVLVRLADKETPFRVLDTHAGAGLYDLTGDEPNRTGEWRDGIGRLWGARLGTSPTALLAPYLDAVRAVNPSEELTHYPGSPALIRHHLREQDRLTACELEPGAAAALARLLRRDQRSKAVAIDGWTALPAYIPFRERRGLVLIDPPFEETREFERLAAALCAAQRKWPTGVYLAWYPIKQAREAERFVKQIASAGIAKVLLSELVVAPPGGRERLRGSGVVLINPPWRLVDDLAIVMPALADVLAPGGAPPRTAWLSVER